MNKSIEFKFRNIPITITVKNVKNISIRISQTDLKVKMSVPYGTTANKIIDILNERYEWIAKTIKRLSEKILNEPEPNPICYKQFVQNFPSLFEKWEKRMGIYATKVSFKYMTSCWGSCRSETKSLTFNLRLANKPTECVEYVIIHELAHIIHPNHSPAFWNLVAQYCPDYLHLRKLLKNG